MPSSSSAASLSQASGRWRRKRHSSATAFSALVLLVSSRSSSVHAVGEGGGLRGSRRRLPQQEQRHYQERQLLSNGESRVGGDGEAFAQEERTLAGRNDNDHADNIVRIDPFSTNLLDVHFPSVKKDDNLLCSAASSHISQYLSDETDLSLTNLGLDCAKRLQRIGRGTRWRLEISGAARFGERPTEDFSAVVRRAFVGVEKERFLKRVYPRYEMVKEKKEWDIEHAHRLSRGRRQRKPNRKPKKKTIKIPKKKTKIKKKGNKKPKKKLAAIRPMSGGGGGGGGRGQSKGGANVMGYVSGTQGNASKKDKGYSIVNGDIHVNLKNIGEGENANGSNDKDKPQKMQQMSNQSRPQNKPQDNGGNNVMGYEPGSQGKDKDEGNKGFEIIGGDIHVEVPGNG